MVGSAIYFFENVYFCQTLVQRTRYMTKFIYTGCLYSFYGLWSVEKSLNTGTAPRKKTSMIFQRPMKHGRGQTSRQSIYQPRHHSPRTMP